MTKSTKRVGKEKREIQEKVQNTYTYTDSGTGALQAESERHATAHGKSTKRRAI
jgi:hypothetical protein